MSEPRGALAGVRVLEWARFVAGPYCAKLFADNGADVVKIEQPGIGDEARSRGPFPGDIPHAERSALFLYLNTNKKGITLDINTAPGKEIFRKLIQEVDILVEDNPPRLVEGLGLDYENLRSINPELIMTSITPFGQTGPYRDYRCYYLNTFHGSGFGYLTPTDPNNPHILEWEPIMLGGFLAEYYSGVNATIPTLAALFAGVGQHIDVSKQETPLQIVRSNIAAYFADGEIPTRSGLSATGAWSGVMPCKDGYIHMMAPEPQLEALFDLMGNPDWSRDEKFKPEVFHLHSLEMRPHVLSWVAEHCKREIWQGGQERGVPIAPVNDVEEVLDSEHLRARDFFVEIDHPEAGVLNYPSAPYRFSETPARFERCAPLLGEHNEEIYCGRLGYSQQDLVNMRETGVI